MSPEGISRATWTLLVASAFPGIGKNTLWQIASDPFFFKTEADDLDGLHPALSHFRSKSPRYLTAESKALRQLELCKKNGVRLIGYWDKEYPAYFRHAPSSPALFWQKGQLSALKMPMAAVIGTREPTHDGQVSAQRITAALAERGIGIVSGLALGIDTIAHQACVASKRPTVAILPCGLDSVAPKQNSGLAQDILDTGGALISEFPIGSPAFSSNFVTRDSTQAALSSAVVLVQTGMTGGSLHACRAAIRLERKLVVVQPTERDALYQEPKAKGNLAIISGDKEMLEKVGFSNAHSEIIYVLKGRDQYEALSRLVIDAWESFNAQSHTPRLID